MIDDEITIIIAMPTDEGKREELARMREANGQGYMKPIIYTGSITVDCTDCGLELGVGPRTQVALRAAPDTPVLCPQKLMIETQEDDFLRLANVS